MGTALRAGRKARKAGELVITLAYVAWCWGYLGALTGTWAVQRRVTGRCVPDCLAYDECERCGRYSARPRGPFTP